MDSSYTAAPSSSSSPKIAFVAAESTYQLTGDEDEGVLATKAVLGEELEEGAAV